MYGTGGETAQETGYGGHGRETCDLGAHQHQRWRQREKDRQGKGVDFHLMETGSSTRQRTKIKGDSKMCV